MTKNSITANQVVPTASNPGVPIKVDPGVLAIYGLLVEAKKRIGGVAKEGKYSASGTTYNFRGVDQVVNAVAGVFNDLGIVVIPEVINSDHQVWDRQMDGGKVGKTFRHIVTVRYTFVAANDGSLVECVTEGEALDTSDKGTAKAMSVALRIALLQTLTLPTDDPDPDSERPEIENPKASAIEEPEPVVWDEDDNRKVREFLEAQSLQIQRSAKVFIRSQRIPLSKLQATEEQLNKIEDFVRELLDEEAARKDRIAEHEATQAEYDSAAEGLDARVAAAKVSTAQRMQPDRPLQDPEGDQGEINIADDGTDHGTYGS